MLEKLIYKNSVVKDWYFDVTMCREAEAFIRQITGHSINNQERFYILIHLTQLLRYGE